MGAPRFTPEFKEEAVKQIVDRGYSVTDVAARCGPDAAPAIWHMSCPHFTSAGRGGLCAARQSNVH